MRKRANPRGQLKAYSVPAAAKELGMTAANVYRLLDLGDLKEVSPIGSVRLVDKRSLEQFKQAREQVAEKTS